MIDFDCVFEIRKFNAKILINMFYFSFWNCRNFEKGKICNFLNLEDKTWSSSWQIGGRSLRSLVDTIIEHCLCVFVTLRMHQYTGLYRSIKRIYYTKCKVKMAPLKLNVCQLIKNPLFVFIINEFMVLQTLVLHFPLLKSFFITVRILDSNGTFYWNGFKWRVFIKKSFSFSDVWFWIFNISAREKEDLTLTANG